MGKQTKIGFIGYSTDCFDVDIAKGLIELSFNVVDRIYNNIDLVSGLTTGGLIGLAYESAVKRDWGTVGIACEKYKDYPVFDVDKSIIVGEDWGDESEEFIKYIDVLIRIGGGEQSKKELKMAQDKGVEIYEYDLPKNDE